MITLPKWVGKKISRAGRGWLMPIILATQGAAIRRTTVPSQSWAKQFERPYLEKKKITKKGWWSGSRCRP
jgi:hypothetical protein